MFSSFLVQFEIPVASDRSCSEQGSPGSTPHSTALGTDATLQEGKAEDAESALGSARAPEPSPSAGSHFAFIFNISAFLRAADEFCCCVSVSNKKPSLLQSNRGGKCIFLLPVGSVLISCFGDRQRS